jgi:hypothetical protein
MARICVCLSLALAMGGCGGHHILTVGDQVAAAGGEAMPVIRLQRNDFFVVSVAVDQAAMRFQVADGKEVGAYTDKLGYAGTTVPVPDRPGRYTMTVTHMNKDTGDEYQAKALVYVWNPDRPVVAVDMDSLPGLPIGSPQQAARAIKRLADGANILYLTRQWTEGHPRAHPALATAGYPDGPVLTWQRQQWHVVREGKYSIPRVVIEDRMVSQLPEIRRWLPKTELGICDSAMAAKAFADAGLKVVMVGSAAVDAKTQLIRRQSWQDLADKGP